MVPSFAGMCLGACVGVCDSPCVVVIGLLGYGIGLGAQQWLVTLLDKSSGRLLVS